MFEASQNILIPETGVVVRKLGEDLFKPINIYKFPAMIVKAKHAYDVKFSVPTPNVLPETLILDKKNEVTYKILV